MTDRNDAQRLAQPNSERLNHLDEEITDLRKELRDLSAALTELRDLFLRHARRPYAHGP